MFDNPAGIAAWRKRGRTSSQSLRLAGTFVVSSRICVFLIAAAIGCFGQGTSTAPYVPGVTFQTTNPNYFLPNPFYFEGRIDWNLLNITTPANAWDFFQRGMHYQDDLQDTADAISDYQQSISLNSLTNGTCQIVTAAVPVPASGTLNPAPCMFAVRLRLAGLLKSTNPTQAINWYLEVTQIDPLRLGVNEAIGDTYAAMAAAAADPGTASTLYSMAVNYYQAELALSPVTPAYTALTADQANNAHIHWALAGIYHTMGSSAQEASELNLYLLATMWHSDTYPWRINLAQTRLAALGVVANYTKAGIVVKPKYEPVPETTRPKKKPGNGN